MQNIVKLVLTLLMSIPLLLLVGHELLYKILDEQIYIALTGNFYSMQQSILVGVIACGVLGGLLYGCSLLKKAMEEKK